jgi:hypothetical protein
MAYMAATIKRAWGLGAALVALTALLCLAVMASRDGRTISLSELSSLHAPLMSCESDGAGSDGLLWCSDPNSPHCIPAAPEPPRLELADRPDLDLASAVPVAEASYVLVPWPKLMPASERGRRNAQRLERPPRT